MNLNNFPILLMILLLTLGCNNKIKVDAEDFKQIDEKTLEVYKLTICRKIVSNLEGDLPEIIPYPKYVSVRPDPTKTENGNLFAIGEDGNTFGEADIVDEAYIFIFRSTGEKDESKPESSDLFIYASTKIYNGRKFDNIRLDQIDVVFAGYLSEVELNGLQDSDGEEMGLVDWPDTTYYEVYYKSVKKRTKGPEGIKWRVRKTSDGVTLTALPYIAHDLVSTTMIQPNQVFDTEIMFYPLDLSKLKVKNGDGENLRDGQLFYEIKNSVQEENDFLLGYLPKNRYSQIKTSQASDKESIKRLDAKYVPEFRKIQRTEIDVTSIISTDTIVTSRF